MSDAAIHTVRFEPMGIEMDVQEGETVLDAAFRQGISVMHGCKEGQCASCKSKLVEGDIELLKYSTFALPESERDTDHILLCRTLAFSDITVELLNYDEDLLSRSIAVKEVPAHLVSIISLTRDIRMLTLELSSPMRFWAGQYVDITIPGSGITRAFSMANAPADHEAGGGTTMQFIIKMYPNGAFSSRLDPQADSGLKSGDTLMVKGPYGTCFHREGRPGPLVLVGGGSGMSPLWSILQDHLQRGSHRPVRFFYGARTKADLFHIEEFAAFGAQLPDFRFIPALSHAEPGDDWTGETGFVHDVVARVLREEGLEGEIDAYSCGPPPMIDAVLPVLQMAGVEPEHIYFDKFTTATR
ncbi:NADH:ubiquinone reductase (Na(+)-transporting) subunit F [Acidisoma sp. S159]|uniref:NADH:ubiquinone reductase (Na(+)-transporting) subunit F n=1 Tax=Acidisoma sp. S159 TaxID=1747225 RepID=UPI001C203A78|nr:2Fe-2S iron-sulfur cluster binding domain-containing protein [Acidisoma sp. S159]